MSIPGTILGVSRSQLGALLNVQRPGGDTLTVRIIEVVVYSPVMLGRPVLVYPGDTVEITADVVFWTLVCPYIVRATAYVDLPLLRVYR